MTIKERLVALETEVKNLKKLLYVILTGTGLNIGAVFLS